MVNHYRWDFIGLSTDSKPTPETSEKVADGSTFYCSDTSQLYVWYKDQWYEKESGEEPYELPIASSETLGGIKVGNNLTIDSETGVLSAITSGGGDIKTLTTADYNYPTDNPSSIAPWLLSDGYYIIPKNAGINVKADINQSASTTVTFIIISGGNVIMVNKGHAYFGYYDNNKYLTSYNVDRYTSAQVLTNNNVVDNLNSSSQDDRYRPLSARAGSSLLTNIEGRIKRGNTTPPDTSTVGQVSTIYTCVNNGTPEIYMCTAVSGSTYTWTKVI